MFPAHTICQLLTLIVAGLSLSQASNKLGIDRSTAHRWTVRAGITGTRTNPRSNYPGPMTTTIDTTPLLPPLCDHHPEQLAPQHLAQHVAQLAPDELAQLAPQTVVGLSPHVLDQLAPEQLQQLLAELPPQALDALAAQVRDQTRTKSWKTLSLAERCIIQCCLMSNPPMSIRKIAEKLGRSPSTISREIERHSFTIGNQKLYCAITAHCRAKNTASQPTKPKKLSNDQLRDKVIDGFNNRFSPEQIAAELKFQYPDQPEMQVSHETIYRELYLKDRGVFPEEVWGADSPLFTRRKCRKQRGRKHRDGRGSKPWIAGCRLEDRPDISDRTEIGHLEGDLVVGPDNSAVITLVDRKTRRGLVAKLPGCRDSATVVETLVEMTRDLPDKALRTLTWDQGVEMAEHARFTEVTGCAVYFCDPHSPWQRGSNENFNRLLRGYFPKGTNFNVLSDADIAEVERLLNTRRRKVLGWESPMEVFNSDVASP